MKHEEQSQQTKQALSQALKRLMEQKSLNRITVQELVEECGVNRKTFYYHFQDIYSLLKWTLEQEAASISERYDLLGDNSQVIEFALDYIESNLSMLQNVLHSIGETEIRRFFYLDIFEPMYSYVSNFAQQLRIHAPDSYKEFLSRFLTEAIAGILVECIAKNSITDRRQLSEYITSTLVTSVPGALRTSAEF
ncbi:MAG: TetR/AcrR family transcriptional regulator C-terminal domain-containing protein [Oscillospiraceae bacterium]